MSQPVSKSVTILLVEDNPGDVVLTREAFKFSRIKNRIVVAADGEEALNILFQREGYEDGGRPDLVLLDLNLPKKDGREVLEEIKQHDQLKHIPVVILTSSEAETDIVKTYDLQAENYLVKPATLEKLCQVIRSLEGFCFNLELSSA